MLVRICAINEKWFNSQWTACSATHPVSQIRPYSGPGGLSIAICRELVAGIQLAVPLTPGFSPVRNVWESEVEPF